jgi:seryl-tRNA synthetase
MAEVAGIADELKAGADRLDLLQAEMQTMLMSLPNLPQPGVPDGADEAGNVEVRRWGTPRVSTSRPRTMRPGRAAGHGLRNRRQAFGRRFTLLRGPAARLHRALAQFMLDTADQEHGYTECWTPYIVNREVLEGTGQLPKFKEDMFWVSRAAATRRRPSST